MYGKDNLLPNQPLAQPTAVRRPRSWDIHILETINDHRMATGIGARNFCSAPIYYCDANLYGRKGVHFTIM